MLLHKHHIRAFWQALLVLLAFAACINDDFADDATCADSDDASWYLSLQLQVDTSGSSTRATGDTYEPGAHDEHEIGPKGNYVILFDGDGNLFGVYPLAMSLADVEHNDYDSDVTKEGDYLRLVHVYSRNGKLPESCLVVLNSSDEFCKKLEEYDGKRFEAKLSDVLKEIWKDNNNPKNIGFADSDHKYFTMTNSIYLDKDGNKKDVVSIKNKIYPTIQEALNNRTIVYVERMVAKFSFEESQNVELYEIKVSNPSSTSDEQVWLFDGYYNKEGDKDPDDPENDPGNLKRKDITNLCRIKITGWGINALETESHIFKNIKNTDYFANWNSSDRYRSHWSEDPHYGDSYPWQYRFAVDRKKTEYYFDEEIEKVNSPLRNYSYNQFVTESAGDGFGRVVYTPENTYGQNVLNDDYDNRTNLLAGTHLIGCAELLLHKDIAGEENPTGETYVPINLYRDRIGVYYKNPKDCLAELIRQFNHVLKTKATMKFHYYDWNNKEQQENDGELFAVKSTGDYQLYYDDAPFTYQSVKGLSDIDLPKATILNGDGKLLPWTNDFIDHLTIKKPTRDDDGNVTGFELLGIYDGDYDAWEEELNKFNDPNPDNYEYEKALRPVTTNDIKSMLLEWVGAIDHFSDGKMYYAVPVMHNATKYIPDEEQEVGDYGVVRNHWYKFILEDILRVGTPVDEPSDAIVPNRVKTNDQMNFKVKIIDWHPISTEAGIL